jgi:hypothetical protein
MKALSAKTKVRKMIELDAQGFTNPYSAQYNTPEWSSASTKYSAIEMALALGEGGSGFDALPSPSPRAGHSTSDPPQIVLVCCAVISASMQPI